MFKTVMTVVILLGFGWAYPPTRARIVLAAKPALEHMGPVGDVLSRPIQRYTTSTEVKFILDQILMSRTEGREVPDAQTFQRWMARRIVTKNAGKDSWGNPYFLIRTGGLLTVGSVGQDGQRGTEDDIKESIPF